MRISVPVLINIARRCLRRSDHWIPQQRPVSISLEPEYLDSAGPEIPRYELLNVQIKAYNFPVLESFSSFVHKTAENMGFAVEDCWASPPQNLDIKTYKPLSTNVENQYSLHIYSRTVQIADVPASQAPLLFEVIQTALPEGVQMNVKAHEPDDETSRYVPNVELMTLKDQLTEMGGPSTSKPRKR